MREHEDDLLKKFSQVIVFYENARLAYSFVQDAIEDTMIRGIPTSAIIYGVSGTGKSTLCEHFEKIYGKSSAVEDAGGVEFTTTVINFEIPAEITIKGMARNMLIALGDAAPTGSSEQMTYKLITVLKTAQVQVIFLDEIQRLCYATTKEVRFRALQWLVSLANKLKIAIILVGTEECADLPNYNQAFRRRFQTLIELKEFTFSQAANSDYMGTLKALDEALYSISKLPRGLHLHDPSISAALYLATGGNLEFLRAIIYKALKRRLRSTDNTGLQKEDFLAACEYMNLPTIADLNPFAVPLPDALHAIDQYRIDLLAQKEKERAKIIKAMRP